MDLDLEVAAADEFDQPIGTEAGQVSRAVQTLTDLRTAGPVDEALSGEVRLVEVSDGETRPSEVQLALDWSRTPDGHVDADAFAAVLGPV
ncbi:hypothetical protein ACF1A5_32965 [Streptomyces sp. NPDC014864]|uniref:hypothetical protein n=1 Tax=Streptomyces sp. NPDC014864 TaxID=3364924 RepID=UPI0036F69763